MPQRDDLTARLRGMRGELDEIFIELWTGPRHRRPPVLAPADVYLTDSPPTLTVQLDLAGVDPADVDIVLDGDELTVRGARTRRPGRRVYQHAEIDWGPFHRRLRIGVAVDAAAATATYERGLLTIALPLARAAPRTAVPISVRSSG